VKKAITQTPAHADDPPSKTLKPKQGKKAECKPAVA